MSPFFLFGVSGWFYHNYFDINWGFFQANSEDPDATTHDAASQLGCTVCPCPVYRALGLIGLTVKWNHGFSLWRSCISVLVTMFSPHLRRTYSWPRYETMCARLCRWLYTTNDHVLLSGTTVFLGPQRPWMLAATWRGKEKTKIQCYRCVAWFIKLFRSTASESRIIPDQWTDRHTDSHNSPQLSCDGV